MNCGTCEQFTLAFPEGMRSDYYREARIGRCKLESKATVRAPVSGKDCKTYKAAQDMDKRIKWMGSR